MVVILPIFEREILLVLVSKDSKQGCSPSKLSPLYLVEFIRDLKLW